MIIFVKCPVFVSLRVSSTYFRCFPRKATPLLNTRSQHNMHNRVLICTTRPIKVRKHLCLLLLFETDNRLTVLSFIFHLLPPAATKSEPSCHVIFSGISHRFVDDSVIKYWDLKKHAFFISERTACGLQCKLDIPRDFKSL